MSAQNPTSLKFAFFAVNHYRDIFMNKGSAPFCNKECRQEQTKKASPVKGERNQDRVFSKETRTKIVTVIEKGSGIATMKGNETMILKKIVVDLINLKHGCIACTGSSCLHARLHATLSE